MIIESSQYVKDRLKICKEKGTSLKVRNNESFEILETLAFHSTVLLLLAVGSLSSWISKISVFEKSNFLGLQIVVFFALSCYVYGRLPDL